MVDTVRGVVRVRKWPKKRGTPKSARQRWWISWFKQANLLAKYADAASQRRAIELTKGTGLYPRDILLKTMRGRLYYWTDPTGKTWYPMAAVQDISDSLDVLAQDPGNVLVRAADRWRKAGPDTPSVGHVLTYVSAALPPLWAAGGGGLQQLDLPGTPFAPDGTVAEYIFDVTAYAELALIFDAITLSASNDIYVRLSVDGGLTYKGAATDYFYLLNSAGYDASNTHSVLLVTNAAASSNHRAQHVLTGIQTTRALWNGQGANSTNVSFAIGGATRFTGPITHLKIWTSGGALFTGGTIAIMGKTV